MLLTNLKMEEMVANLEPLLPHRDKVGYFAARNTRVLKDNLTEYLNIKEDLICKYGEQEMDEEGNPLPTYKLAYSDEKFQDYKKEIEQFASIEHDVTLLTMPYDEVIGLLSGAEMLSVDWMFYD